ncbi:MAG: hypothetical protein AAFR04_15880, partial [Pseudomonadota bacterium]
MADKGAFDKAKIFDDDPPFDQAKADAFDTQAWMRELLKANPWASAFYKRHMTAIVATRWVPAAPDPLDLRSLASDAAALQPDAEASQSDADALQEAFEIERRNACLRRWAQHGVTHVRPDQQGDAARRWNAWADKMWALRARLLEAGRWSSNDRGQAKGEAAIYHALALADFGTLGSRLSLLGDSLGKLSFSGFAFPGGATFAATRFGDKARQTSALFNFARFNGGDARFNEARFNGGDAQFDGTRFNGGAAKFDGARFNGGSASFVIVRFNGGAARFVNVRFNGGSAGFPGSRFNGGHADFDASRFNGGSARFEHARFSGGAARFFRAQFNGGDAGFSGARFAGERADFSRTKAENDVKFQDCHITCPITFEGAELRGAVSFKRAKAQSAFDLSGTRFRRPPDFTQTDMARTPRVDNIAIKPAILGTVFETRPFKLLGRTLFTYPVSVDRDAPAKARQLKRYAIENQDTASELNLAAEETRAARWVTDWPFRWWASVLPGIGFRFWAGYLYATFSNFGRSILRPTLFWVAGLLGFTLIYLGAMPSQPAET